MEISLITLDDLQKLSADISKQLARLEDKIDSASIQAKYADLKTITKLLGYTSTQRMRAFIETAIEEGHTIRMIKPKINRYDNTARIHYNIQDVENAFLYSQKVS
jgi:uncharacterized protein YhaN